MAEAGPWLTRPWHWLLRALAGCALGPSAAGRELLAISISLTWHRLSYDMLSFFVSATAEMAELGVRPVRSWQID
jgi:hypothetical protein